MSGKTAMPLTEHDRRSLEERILNIVDTQGAVTLDQLVHSVSAATWAPVFLAVDRLSRDGQISLRRRKSGEYEISRRYGYTTGLLRGDYERARSPVEWMPSHADPVVIGV